MITDRFILCGVAQDSWILQAKFMGSIGFGSLIKTHSPKAEAWIVATETKYTEGAWAFKQAATSGLTTELLCALRACRCKTGLTCSTQNNSKQVRAIGGSRWLLPIQREKQECIESLWLWGRILRPIMTISYTGFGVMLSPSYTPKHGQEFQPAIHNFYP